MRLAVKIAYDGFNYQGYARQPNLNTIEGQLIQVLLDSNVIDSIKDAQFRVSSRTDKGVSSLGNVVTLWCNHQPNELIDIVNSELNDIFIFGYKKVDNDYNPRHAKMRSYRYYLNNTDLDIYGIIEAANRFTGKHDFRNFARVETHRNPVRIIENIIIDRIDSFLIIDIYAQTFLWHQIRRILAALKKIGEQKLSQNDLQNALDNSNVSVDYGLAPAHPLLLTNVEYDLEFNYLKNYKNRLTQIEQNVIKRL